MDLKFCMQMHLKNHYLRPSNAFDLRGEIFKINITIKYGRFIKNIIEGRKHSFIDKN